MDLYKFDTNYKNALTPEGLCNLIEQEYQPQIKACYSHIYDYLLLHPQISELPVSVSELVHLLFIKLKDEIKHVFLKETGILFPLIKNSFKGLSKTNNCIDDAVVESLKNKQYHISALLQKIRQLLHNYTIENNYSNDLKNCIDELYTLENKIFEWMHVEQNILFPKISCTNTLSN